MTKAQVNRRRHDPRVTLSAELLAALRARSEADGVPVSRIIEAAARIYLGLPRVVSGAPRPDLTDAELVAAAVSALGSRLALSAAVGRLEDSWMAHVLTGRRQLSPEMRVAVEEALAKAVST